MRACVAVADPDPLTALQRCKEAADQGADLIEVRFDLMDSLPGDLKAYRRIAVPLIATLRSMDQGGRYDGTPEGKLGFLRSAVAN
ncbi:MAG TPA: type I 3-dehydroquinate dehydratase, partial [Methanomassiliicoccales archaeon]|nr:type I 3-dehydroquinate dehydratase [Methanomassiliicoccales archaeon]